VRGLQVLIGENVEEDEREEKEDDEAYRISSLGLGAIALQHAGINYRT
jgi:hypothetical protein